VTTGNPCWRLDYVGLKKRLGGIPIRRRKTTKPAFVELTAPHAAPIQMCDALSRNRPKLDQQIPVMRSRAMLAPWTITLHL
jgi:hypothetical protein